MFVKLEHCCKYIVLFAFVLGSASSANAGMGAGCASKSQWILGNSAYSQAVATHCEKFLTAQNSCKAHKTWRQNPNGIISYDYSDWNVIKNFANGHGLTPRCHALVWLEQTPAWFYQLSNSQLRAGAMGAVTAAINNGARHLEIVNEPERGLGIYEKLGPQFIGDLYRHARQRCPSCTLAINFLNPPSISYIRAIDYPVNVIGLEAHIGNSVPNWEGWIREVRAMGYQVLITEYDQPSTTREPAQSFAAMAKRAGVNGFIVWNLVTMPDDSWRRGAPLDYPSMTPNAMYSGLVAGLTGQPTQPPPSILPPPPTVSPPPPTGTTGKTCIILSFSLTTICY